MKYGEIETGVSLIDFLAKEVDCAYISDLTHLSARQQQRLAAVLEKLPSEAASQREWDDALSYIETLPPQTDAEKDRQCLLAALSQEWCGKQKSRKRKEHEK